jgi:hypothetical protein
VHAQPPEIYAEDDLNVAFIIVRQCYNLRTFLTLTDTYIRHPILANVSYFVTYYIIYAYTIGGPK